MKTGRDSQLRAGVGRQDITPPLGSPLFGYPNPGRVGLTVRDGLNVTALVLDDNGLRAAILTFDLCLSDDQSVADIRRAVQEKTGIPPANITVCYSHTHSGPITQSMWGWGERDEPYLAAMIPKAAAAAALALENLQPVRIGIGTTESDVAVNRRQIMENHTVGLGNNPWGPYDPRMTVLRIEGPHGPLASLIHYGAHPTVLDGSTRAISRDWPGVMIDRVEHFTKAPALFIVGALGDVAPRCNTLSAVGDGEAALQEVGGRAAMDALRAWRSIKELRALDLAVLTQPVALPYQPLPSLEVAQQELAEREPNKAQPGSGICEYMHWSAVVAELKNAPQTHKTIEQTITRIGPVAIVPFPGETFSEIVLRLRHASPIQHTLCASATNGSNGYLVTRESRPRGGYEVWVARAYGAYLLADNIDDVLVEENLKLLRALASQ